MAAFCKGVASKSVSRMLEEDVSLLRTREPEAAMERISKPNMQTALREHNSIGSSTNVLTNDISHNSDAVRSDGTVLNLQTIMGEPRSQAFLEIYRQEHPLPNFEGYSAAVLPYVRRNP